MLDIRTIPRRTAALLVVIVIGAVAFGGPLHQATPHSHDSDIGDPGPCLICKVTERAAGPSGSGPMVPLLAERTERITPRVLDRLVTPVAQSPTVPRAPPRSA